MARSIDITIPAHRTELLLEDLERVDGILGIRLTPGASRRPAGDVITVLTTNAGLHPLLRLLDARGIPSSPDASVTCSEPSGVISCTAAPRISADSTEIPWEEMEYTMARESTIGPNGLVTMAAAGAIAAAGIATSALHLVLAAMLIAPGFEPIVRVSLGVLARAPVWRRGVRDFAAGYAALFGGAVLTSLVLLALGRELPVSDTSYLHAGELPKYWSTITGPTILVSAVAGFTGTVLITNNRSVLTAGVMVALSLVPTVALAGMGLVARNLALAGQALLVWGVDVALVLVMGMLAFLWKRATVQRRPMMGTP